MPVVFTRKAVTFIHDLFLRIFFFFFLVLAEITTNCQKGAEKRGTIWCLYMRLTASEPSVLTLLLKQTRLFMRAKLNQTVGMAGKKKTKTKQNICL